MDANPGSWPGLALIYFNFKGNIRFSDGGTKSHTELVDLTFMCSGALINRRTILTASHCVMSHVTYTMHNGTDVDIPVGPTDYYSSTADMISVYLGVQVNTSTLKID